MEQINVKTAEVPKLTISETITERKQVEKSIPLPYYFKDSLNRFCKVISDKCYIQVDDAVWSIMFGIQTRLVDLNKDQICKGAPCTKEEYDIAFDKVMTNIQMLNQDDDALVEADENVQIDEMIENKLNGVL